MVGRRDRGKRGNIEGGRRGRSFISINNTSFLILKCHININEKYEKDENIQRDAVVIVKGFFGYAF